VAGSEAVPAAEGGGPTLRELVKELFARHEEPRTVREVLAELATAHPDRKEPGVQVVRNTLEALVAKGFLDRERRRGSVSYTVRSNAASTVAVEADATAGPRRSRTIKRQLTAYPGLPWPWRSVTGRHQPARAAIAAPSPAQRPGGPVPRCTRRALRGTLCKLLSATHTVPHGQQRSVGSPADRCYSGSRQLGHQQGQRASRSNPGRGPPPKPHASPTSTRHAEPHIWVSFNRPMTWGSCTSGFPST
jgi:hypothetical protein